MGVIDQILLIFAWQHKPATPHCHQIVIQMLLIPDCAEKCIAPLPPRAQPTLNQREERRLNTNI